MPAARSLAQTAGIGTRTLHLATHASDIGAWEMARASAAPALRPYVREYVGWWERGSAPIYRRELPTDIVPLMINFGAPVRIYHARDERRWSDFGSFTTGVYDTYVIVGTSGPSGGIQVNLTILGARLILGLPLRDLANRAVSLDDVFGRDASRLEGELYDAPDWGTRFDRIDLELARRLEAARALSPNVLWVMRRLAATSGRVAIGRLVTEAGCSQKHLVAQFKEEIGATPKTLARLLRFGRAVDSIKKGAVRLADIALDCGYYDQAHFDRDFRSFAGVSPTELIKATLPDGGGFAVDR